MKRISLLRHADAADRNPDVSDVDRPLTARGRNDAVLMGGYLAERDHLPDLALCSPSARTRETLDCVCSRLSEPPRRVFRDDIYNAAGPQQLLDAVQALPDDCDHVLLVGHNPSMHQFSLALAAVSDDSALGELAKKFSKGALAQFDVEIDDWRQCELASGRLVGFTRPKDLRA